MLINYFGPTDLLDTALFDSNTGALSIALLSGTATRVVIQNTSTGAITTFLGAGFTADPITNPGGVLGSVTTVNASGRTVGTVTGLNWPVLDFLTAIDAMATGSDTLWNQLLSRQDVTFDARLSNHGAEAFFASVTSNLTLIGSPYSDVFIGGAGNDILRSGGGRGGGNDSLAGMGGNDILYGGDWADTLNGGAGNDAIYGGATSDDLDDLIFGGDGVDTLYGHTGNDVIYGGDGPADLRDIIHGGMGDDWIDMGYGNDLTFAGLGNDSVEGGYGADEINGQEGNDQLSGGVLSDLIYGGDGFDFINGGFGHDRLNGGLGGDRFYHLGVAGHGSDWVQEYNATQGDVLMAGIAGAVRAQFLVQFSTTPGAGQADVQEAFITYRPTGQVLWALVDGAAQAQINLVLGGQSFDLLA